jgi:hypothetical protein
MSENLYEPGTPGDWTDDYEELQELLITGEWE